MAEQKTMPNAGQGAAKEPGLEIKKTDWKERMDKREKLDTELLKAAEEGRTGDVKRLLDEGANIEAIFENSWVDRVDDDGGYYPGRSPLIRAAWWGHTDTCRLLVERGANVNAKDKYDITAFMYAAEYGYIDTCALLIEKGADIWAISGEMKTALMKAAIRGHTSICAFLLEKAKEQGRDAKEYIEAKDRGGDTAFLLAKSYHNIETAGFLSFELSGPLLLPDKEAKDLFYSAFKKCVGGLFG
jgi:ankyrin repeat protein